MKFSGIEVEAAPLYTQVFEGMYWLVFVACLGLCMAGLILGWSVLALLGGIGLLLLIYGGWIEPRWIQVSRYEQSLTNDPQISLRIVFVSDLHIGGHKPIKFYKRAAGLIEKLSPDLLLFGGDYVDARSSAIHGLSCFSAVRCPLGKFFVLGNHDFDDDPQLIRSALRSFGFTDLRNTLRSIEHAGRAFTLIGLDDAWFGQPDVSILDSVQNIPTVLLTHEPDILFDLPDGAVDLVLFGHTHGGQIRWPFLGPVSPLPQSAPASLDQGRRHWKKMPMIISRGLGESGSRVRFFARPEIVVIDLSF